MSDTTDLYSAAESLLMPEQAEENLVEDQADEADVSDDDQDIAEDVDLGDDDDAEPSDSEEEVDVDVDEDAEEIADDETEDDTNEAQLFPVTVDGKEEMWTLEQLKQSASGQGKINKGFQEVAQARREVDEMKSRLEQQEAEILQAYQALQSGQYVAPPTPPSKDLLQKDPIGYLEAEVTYKEELAAYQQNMMRLQQVDQQKTQREQAAMIAKRDEAAKRLGERIPEYANPDTREAFAKSIIKTAEEYGFNQDEMIGLMDDRYVLALNDAKKYREMMKRRENAKSKQQTAPVRQPIKAGAKKVKEDATSARKKAEQRLRKTGSIDDAVNLIFNS